MTGSLLMISTAPPGPSGTTTAVTGQPPTTVPGPRQDSADFYGVFGAIAIIVGAILVIRLAFRRPSRPRGRTGPPPSPSPGPGPGPAGPTADAPSSPAQPSPPPAGEKT